jgi:cleavage stimulation factor subunit 3
MFTGRTFSAVVVVYCLLQVDSASKMFADEAAALYERAISSLLKSCILIYFAFADFEEVRIKYFFVSRLF